MIIVDARGLSLSTLRHISIIKTVASIGPPYYPEGTHRVLVVNAPRIFAAAWALVSPLLPTRTRNKVSILSASATPAALDEVVAPEQLPAFLGGTKPEEEGTVCQALPVPFGAGAALSDDGERDAPEA